MNNLNLPCEEMDDLINRYYNKESIKSLVERFNLPDTRNIFRFFPPAEVSTKCEYCGTNLVKRYASRSYCEKLTGDAFCQSCNHRDSRYCDCTNCQKRREKIQESRRKKIYEEFSSKPDPREYDELSFEQKVYLGALYYAFGEEKTMTVNPQLQSSKHKLTPLIQFDTRIVNELIQKEIITINPYSSIDAFVFDSNDYPSKFDCSKVVYDINVYDICDLHGNATLIEELIRPKINLDENSEEALCMWYEISVHECIEYLEYQMSKVKFEFAFGERALSVMRDILSFLSVSQVYSVIYSSVKDISKRFLEGNMSRKSASSMVVTYIQKRAENIRVSKWSCFQYSRLYNLPQSALSSYFFDKVLSIGEQGFTCTPSKSLFLPNNQQSESESMNTDELSDN